MILLTVGTQRPFDRFIQIMDAIQSSLEEPIFAQIGRGAYKPVNMEWRPFVGAIEFQRMVAQCSLIVSHAGIGTVVMAQKHHKPVILFPRRAELREHVNDHQLATVEALEGRDGMYVARTAEELRDLIGGKLEPALHQEENRSRDRLRKVVYDFISQG